MLSFHPMTQSDCREVALGVENTTEWRDAVGKAGGAIAAKWLGVQVTEAKLGQTDWGRALLILPLLFNEEDLRAVGQE